MYKLLIFDWDGTIIDSAARIVSSMQSAARDLGLPELTDDAVRDIIGLGLPEAIRILVPGINDDMLEKLRQLYSTYYITDDPTPTALFPGVKQSLESLHAKGYRLAVATGKSRRGLDRVLADTGLGWLFETSRCADETTSKPDPHMLREILQETAVQASDAVMIGDTEYDLGMGVNAGMDVIGVSYGVHHQDRLKVFDPVMIAHRFIELEQWLESQSAVVEE